MKPVKITKLTFCNPSMVQTGGSSITNCITIYMSLAEKKPLKNNGVVRSYQVARKLGTEWNEKHGKQSSEA